MHPKPTRHNTPDTDPAADWRTRAVCATSDPELFFPVGKIETNDAAYRQTQLAKAVCARCVVSEICLQYALETNEYFGIWGGMTEEERRVMKRRANRQRRFGRLATSESDAIL